ncbi:hypothetical protein FQN54_000894 [Arachnomyces sp. PD_36]|nr:hypothetical protein FQN54_000894 [Arachnomyces sp. PD_36]
MSFGFSIGDFLRTVELVNEIRSRFVDAPNQFKAMTNELRSLKIILDDVHIVLPQRNLTEEQAKELREIAEGCNNVLYALKQHLEKHQELNPNPNGLDAKSFRSRVQNGWERLRWDPKDVQELRLRITSNVSLVNSFYGALTRKSASETKSIVNQLYQRQHDEEQQTILDWLSSVEYGLQQSDLISRRQEGTGQCLLNSNEFQKWLEKRKQTLFCPGIPGAGKTMNTAIVIEHIWAKFQNDTNVGVAYLYCNFRREHEQKTTDLLASLLKQLIREQISFPESIRSLYNRHNGKGTRPKLDEILSALQSVIPTYARTFIIIDAVDECGNSDGSRSRLLSAIFDLQASTGANVFATSRFIPDIVKEFEGRSSSLEIRASNEDAARYLEGRMWQLPSFVARNSDFQKEIKTEIIRAVDGMFLLLRLYLDSLMCKRSPKAIRTALRNMQKRSKASTGGNTPEALHDAYEEAMERIQGQVPDSRDLAKETLSWITFARRPLTTTELQHALAIEPGEPRLDEDNISEIDDIISACAGLVVVDDECDIIRLVHYTTQEYFDRTWNHWFPEVQTHVAKMCLTYLIFDDFELGFCPSDAAFEERLRSNVFYDYAANNWARHARGTPAEYDPSVLDLFKNESKTSSFAQAMMRLPSWMPKPYSQRVPRGLTGLHIAAYFGLGKTIVLLLENGLDLNARDSYHRTPLAWAAENGHEAVVKLLLARKDVDIGFKKISAEVPFITSSGYGHEAVVSLPLARDGVHPDFKDRQEGAPFIIASEHGHEVVVKVPPAREDVDPDLEYRREETPLSIASAYGHEAIVKLLLEKGADVNAGSKNNTTPLMRASSNGHEAVVKLLLDKSADANAGSKSNWTALMRASSDGHEAVVKLLLDEGADVNASDRHGRTALMLASPRGRGCEAVFELLLDSGADINAKDCFGKTVLMLASARGHDRATATKLLLDRGADIHIQTRDGKTALMFASRADHPGCEIGIELLLDKGADINSQAKNGRTALMFASTGIHGETPVKLLLDRGADINIEDKNGDTALSLAKKGNREAIARLITSYANRAP